MKENQPVIILGISITDRTKAAVELQRILTDYGCSIRTRIGLHDVSTEYCSSQGVVILELFGAKEESKQIEEELLKLDGVDVQKMVFK